MVSRCAWRFMRQRAGIVVTPCSRRSWNSRLIVLGHESLPKRVCFFFEFRQSPEIALTELYGLGLTPTYWRLFSLLNGAEMVHCIPNLLHLEQASFGFK